MMDRKVISDFRGEYRWLSNFHLVPIEYEGIIYPSTEHAYQAAKTLDVEIRKSFLNLTCREAKKMGMEIDLRPNWDLVKRDIMKDVNRIKFQDSKLRNQLLETGDAELIEGNTWGDRYWGVCNGKGSNHLGKILMQIRQEIFENNFLSLEIVIV